MDRLELLANLRTAMPSEASPTHCPKFLALLAEFYAALPDEPPTDALLIDPQTMPQPQRRLLFHTRDMTSTLSAFHGEPVVLRVLHRVLEPGTLARHIVLETERTGRPVEYGAIRIQLRALPEDARNEVIECRKPLGGILNQHGVAYACCPGGFFAVRPNELMRHALRLERPRVLYGRCNCLSGASGEPIAEVVEILP